MMFAKDSSLSTLSALRAEDVRELNTLLEELDAAWERRAYGDVGEIRYEIASVRADIDELDSMIANARLTLS